MLICHWEDSYMKHLNIPQYVELFLILIYGMFLSNQCIYHLTIISSNINWLITLVFWNSGYLC